MASGFSSDGGGMEFYGGAGRSILGDTGTVIKSDNKIFNRHFGFVEDCRRSERWSARKKSTAKLANQEASGGFSGDGGEMEFYGGAGRSILGDTGTVIKSDNKIFNRRIGT
ncbi:hypothetical protein F2Q69_00017292 [Brassica cretica]|uniref:Uncharacterized protein n=1 Tax=Brassica cretica TaxID=69181 RepID=A0A8S9QXD9_BRACR|nr:hypothetical protein F2Q69_00017292 [Brassica cretica]